MYIYNTFCVVKGIEIGSREKTELTQSWEEREVVKVKWLRASCHVRLAECQVVGISEAPANMPTCLSGPLHTAMYAAASRGPPLPSSQTLSHFPQSSSSSSILKASILQPHCLHTQINTKHSTLSNGGPLLFSSFICKIYKIYHTQIALESDFKHDPPCSLLF